MSLENNSRSPLWQKLNAETARISWQEIAPQFAAGNLIAVDPSLDLIDIAIDFSEDNHMSIKALLHSEKITKVIDSQALDWQARNQNFWAVVVKPWVLIQTINK